MSELWVLDAPSKSVAKRIVVQAGLREATDAEILAAAANLDGAEQISELPKTCKHGQTTMHDHPNGESRCAGPIAEAKHYLRIPLPDKETLSCGCMSEGATCENALPDKETPITTSVTYPNIACRICGRLEGVHKLDCPAS